MKIGDKIYVRAEVDEIRKDCVICKNEGGYFGTIPEEIYTTADIVLREDYDNMKADRNEWVAFSKKTNDAVNELRSKNDKAFEEIQEYHRSLVLSGNGDKASAVATCMTILMKIEENRNE